MDVLGFSPVVVVLVICIVGIALRVYIGITKNPGTPFNVNAVILSFIVGIIVSVGLVAPVIDAIPNDTDNTVVLSLIAGQIIVVMKSQSISTAANNLIKNTKTPEVKKDDTKKD